MDFYKKLREKYKLCNVGDIYYLAQIGENEKKCVIKVNETTVYLWKLLYEYQSDAAIVQFCSDYDITEELAKSEIGRFLDYAEKLVNMEI